MPAVKSLAEHSMRAIMANMDAVDSLGTLPYRLAKPIMMLMPPEKLMEIEKNSPVSLIFIYGVELAPDIHRAVIKHLKEDDQGILNQRATPFCFSGLYI